ncbi:hypothetical protein HK102_002148 [Quaeritorhiza haematococci]|nr:hypothetical protein HK102_002148 [Quaeritorhiza haematococci]
MFSKTLSAVAATALLMASGANAQGQWCSADKSTCVSGTVQGSNITFVMSTSAAGWVAMGIGSGMADADVVLGWANAGSTVVTDRTASGYLAPALDTAQAVTAVAPPAGFAPPAGHNLVVAFTRPLAASGSNKAITPGTSQNFIWAVNSAPPAQPANPSSSIAKHSAKGTFKCDFGAPNCGAAPAGGSGGSGSGAAPIAAASGVAAAVVAALSALVVM